MTAPVLAPLVLAAHGSPHPGHAPAVLMLRDAVAAATSCPRRVQVGWLGHGEPALADAVAAAGSCVVVPLLLTEGHHARVDVPAAVRGVRGAVLSPVLGPHPLLAAALARRLHEAGARPGDRVLIGAAGSSDDAARGQSEQMAELLAERWHGPVGTAYASGPGDRVAAAAGRLPARTGRALFVATFLLGPGTLADRLARDAVRAGGTATAPLGTAPEVLSLVLERWATCSGRLPQPAALVA